MLKNLVCPISPETIDKRASRLSAGMTAGLLVAYGITGLWPILAFVVFDYVVRVFTRQRAPVSWVACHIVQAIGLESRPTSRGPKMFAWRVGFIMSLVALALAPLSPTASVIAAVALAGFNVLDGVLNFCVGCVIYTHLVLPYYTRAATSGGAPD